MHFAEELTTIIEQAVHQFQFITEEEWNSKPNPAKWSKKEILGHLIDSCATNTRRFTVTQYEQNQVIVYRQNEWVAFQNYQATYYKNIIDLWRLMNSQLAFTVSNIPAHKLSYTCITNEPKTLQWLIEDYLRHLEHHLQQITG